MTESVLARKLADILSRVSRVRELLPAKLEEFEANRTEAEALILNLFLALQACSDLALYVVADRGFGVPAGPRGAYEALVQAGLLSAPLARHLAGAVGLRNRIAHEYGTLDLRLVFEAARDDAPDLEAFVREMSRAYEPK